MDLCRFLRWKGYEDELDGDTFTETVLHNHVPYQCLKTCQPWGTDGAVAAPETCTRARACWTGRVLPVSEVLLAALRDPDPED
jgi:hypothetical protein